MNERRKEIRTLYDTIPESMKPVKLKFSMFKSYEAETADISSLGMGFISKETFELDLRKPVFISVYFNNIGKSVRAKVVYCYPISGNKTRAGIIFEDESELKYYNKLLAQEAKVK